MLHLPGTQRHLSIRCFILLLLVVSSISAQNPVFQEIEDVDGLPRVLLIGDSISIGYTLPVRRYLSSKANVHRIATNAGPTTRGLANLDQWLGDSKWDVIHFNFGLHDLKYVNDQGGLVPPQDGKLQVPPEEYQANLTTLVGRLKATGAKLIWCTTTPVPEGARGRIRGDAARYNQLAHEVMTGPDHSTQLVIHDLFGFATSRLAHIQQPANVHFTRSGSDLLGKQVAKAIERVLPKPTDSLQLARGTVFHDSNKNQRLDENEPRLTGIRVSNGREIVTTDDAGHFELPVDQDDIVFVIKPQGWRTPLDEDNLPRFYYIHKPHGSPVLDFDGVAPTGPLPEAIDFPLYPQDEPSEFRALLFGDPQPRDNQEVDYVAHDVVEELIGSDASFGVTLGDIVFDDLDVMTPLNQTIALIGIPWYNVIGNHDINYDARHDQHSDETFERVYGPAYYSFDYGQVHFLVLDDIRWLLDDQGKGKYVGGLGKDQLAFIREDLAGIPETQLVVLLMHIPLVNVEDRAELYRMIEQRPFCVSVSGHTHHHEHRFIKREDGWEGPQPHHHIINVTVCGSWWSGAPDERGIPHTTMADGAPNGYSILRFDGHNYQLDYKAAGRPADYQMQIYAPDTIAPSEIANTTVWANVFNGSERARVELRVGQAGPWLPMKPTLEIDPLLQETYEREMSLAVRPWRDLSKPKPSTHLWKTTMPADTPTGVTELHVRMTDMNGRTFLGRRSIRIQKREQD